MRYLCSASELAHLVKHRSVACLLQYFWGLIYGPRSQPHHCAAMTVDHTPTCGGSSHWHSGELNVLMNSCNGDSLTHLN